MPSLIVIHSHLLDGITASAGSLPPFLPASDPRLPDVRQGKVLSLHHLKDKSFTYMDTQLSKYYDLAAHPPTLGRFRANGSHTQVVADPAAPDAKRRASEYFSLSQSKLESVKRRIKNSPILPISNETMAGYDSLTGILEKGKTYCLLGSSGVGKSTLMNKLSDRPLMKTSSISTSTHKGRHVTTHRELIILPAGGILIDNPGMREIGITDAAQALEATFDEIMHLAQQCKFGDCTHTSEKGCAVTEAVKQGKLDEQAYENFLKMEREQAHFDLSVSEKRKKDKTFGKMIKNVKTDMQKLSAKHHKPTKK